MSIVVETFPVAPLGCNCSVIIDTEAKLAIVVDPGGELPKIRARLDAHGAKVTSIIHTHTHIDHVGATAPLQRQYGAPARIHEDDRFLYELLPVQAAMLGCDVPETCELDGDLKDGVEVRAGEASVGVIHTPGHTPGSLCFSLTTKDGALLFAGDTLFRRGIGRTDLWGGDSDKIIASIEQRLYVLDPMTKVITGHGPATTIGDESRANPFVRRG